MSSNHKQDLYGGILLMLVGLGAVLVGRTYKMGNLAHMGPGFFPVALGAVMTVIGMLIAGGGLAAAAEDDVHDIHRPEWRGWLCIIAGPLLFIIFGQYCGLVPATFSCVFVSALGDRTSTLKGAMVVAGGVTLFGVLLFSYVLGVALPLWQWGSP